MLNSGIATLFRSIWQFVAAQDIFISYSRHDHGRFYATHLARELQRRKYQVVMDTLEARPSEQVPEPLLRELEFCRLLVIVASARAIVSDAVAAEVARFPQQARRTIVLVDFDVPASTARWYPTHLPGLPSINDLSNPNAPSPHIVEFIDDAFRYKRQRERQLIAAALVGVVTVGMLATTAWLGRRLAATTSNLNDTRVMLTNATADLTKKTDDLGRTQIQLTKAHADVEEQTNVGRALRLSNDAVRFRNDQFDLSLLLSLEARKSDTFEARDAFFTTSQAYPNLLGYLDHPARTYDACFGENANILASVGEDQTPRMWKVATMRAMRGPSTQRGTTALIACSPVGEMFAWTVLSEGIAYIKLWNLMTQQPAGTWPSGQLAGVRRIFFSPDGTILGSVGGDNTVRFWDVKTQHQIGTQFSVGGLVESVAFSPSWKLAVGTFDGKIWLWDASTPRQPSYVGTLVGHQQSVVSLTFSSDSKTLASSSDDKSIRLWNVATQSELSVSPLQGYTGPVKCLVFSSDGQTLTSAGDDGTLRIWDLRTGNQTGNPIDIMVGQSLAFSSDGKILATADRGHALLLWKVRSEYSFDVPLPEKLSKADHLVFSPDGKTVAVARHYDKTLLFWRMSARHPKLYRAFYPPAPENPGILGCLTYSGDGRIIAACDDTKVLVWDVGTGNARTSLSGPPNAPNSFTSVAFSPDSKIAALAGRYGLALCRLIDGQQTELHVPSNQRSGAPAGFASVAFSPDGKKLVSGGFDNRVRIWDVESAKNEQVLQGHQSVVDTVSYSPDGRTIASGSTFDNTLRLWDADTGKSEREPLPIHRVTKVAFSPDGKMLAAATYDGVQVWDIAARKPFTASLSRHGVQINEVPSPDLAFSPNGKILATMSDGTTVQLWSFDSSKWLERDCQRANRRLSRDEWDHYIGRDTPDHQACD